LGLKRALLTLLGIAGVAETAAETQDQQK